MCSISINAEAVAWDGRPAEANRGVRAAYGGTMRGATPPFRVEFYDARAAETCMTESDAHCVIGASKGAIWWEPDSLTEMQICRRDTADSADERERRDSAWRVVYLEYLCR